MTLHVVNGKHAADAMVRFPKTLGPAARLDEIRAFFEDDHVHMALIVATDRRLVTTIERPDLGSAMPGATPAAELGSLTGRTARPTDRLETLAAVLLRQRRRRLAVVDDTGRLLGLLCLRKDGTGYCSDEGIRERANHARRSLSYGSCISLSWRLVGVGVPSLVGLLGAVLVATSPQCPGG
ncbi:MAG: CBS domain-containing protein, partial [Streptosporangiaceae bacterium]